MSKEEIPPKCVAQERAFLVKRGCGKTDDLAQCPECHLWFCKEHDTHECIPQPQTSEMQQRIEWAKMNRDFGAAMVGIACLIDVTVLALWGDFLSSNLSTFTAFSELVLITVSMVGIGYGMKHHYSSQLGKLGVRMRSSRPQTDKKDH